MYSTGGWGILRNRLRCAGTLPFYSYIEYVSHYSRQPVDQIARLRVRARWQDCAWARAKDTIISRIREHRRLACRRVTLGQLVWSKPEPRASEARAVERVAVRCTSALAPLSSDTSPRRFMLPLHARSSSFVPSEPPRRVDWRERSEATDTLVLAGVVVGRGASCCAQIVCGQRAGRDDASPQSATATRRGHHYRPIRLDAATHEHLRFVPSRAVHSDGKLIALRPRRIASKCRTPSILDDHRARCCYSRTFRVR